jgi:hypothetical protein
LRHKRLKVSSANWTVTGREWRDVNKNASGGDGCLELVSRPGTDEVTMREIDREITGYRNEKRLERR